MGFERKVGQVYKIVELAYKIVEMAKFAFELYRLFHGN
jgi:hypothetical protein